MATLDELLDLLPDNSTGEITAADLRTVVTELFNASALLEARVGALETAPSGDDSISVTGRWQIFNQPGVAPGGQQATSDTGIFATATWIRFSKFDKDVKDSTLALTNADLIYGQQQDDASNWIKWQVAGVPTVAADYVHVPVTFLKGGGVAGSVAWHDALFVIKVVGL